MFATVLSALWDLLWGRWFGKKTDPEISEAKHDEAISEKQAAIVADHTRPDAISSLSDGKF